MQYTNPLTICCQYTFSSSSQSDIILPPHPPSLSRKSSLFPYHYTLVSNEKSSVERKSLHSPPKANCFPALYSALYRLPTLWPSCPDVNLHSSSPATTLMAAGEKSGTTTSLARVQGCLKKSRWLCSAPWHPLHTFLPRQAASHCFPRPHTQTHFPTWSVHRALTRPTPPTTPPAPKSPRRPPPQPHTPPPHPQPCNYVCSQWSHILSLFLFLFSHVVRARGYFCMRNGEESNQEWRSGDRGVGRLAKGKGWSISQRCCLLRMRERENCGFDLDWNLGFLLPLGHYRPSSYLLFLAVNWWFGLTLITTAVDRIAAFLRFYRLFTLPGHYSPPLLILP